LTDGAVFKNTLKVDNFRCNYTSIPSSPTTVVPVSIVNGVAGDSVVTFKMPDGAFTSVDGKQLCQFSGQIALYSGSTKEYGISVTAYLKVLANNDLDKTVDKLAGSVVSFKQSYVLSVSPNEVMINVAAPHYSQKFGAAGTLSAAIGSFSYALADSKIYKANATDGTLSQVTLTDVLADGTKIVLTGDPLRSEDLLVVRQSTDTSLSDKCKTVVVAGTGPFEIKTASTVSGAVSFDSVKATEFEKASFCLVASGNKRIEKGSISFSLTKPTGSGANLDVPGDNIITTLKKNGTSVKVLNLPAPDDTSETVNIRIYNMSSNETKVYGTLYDMNGAIVGSKSNAELATVPANGVKVINAKSIGSVLGVTTWTGRGWLQLEGDAQGIRVQALAYTGQPSATGARTIINMSDRVKADSER
jgi:hypothetical protein